MPSFLIQKSIWLFPTYQLEQTVLLWQKKKLSLSNAPQHYITGRKIICMCFKCGLCTLISIWKITRRQYLISFKLTSSNTSLRFKKSLRIQLILHMHTTICGDFEKYMNFHPKLIRSCCKCERKSSLNEISFEHWCHNSADY